ncbi:MAG: ORF6N domain-containing protein [Bacteroidetes bacterium]|nr:ORF6N domain-containing protein [Bacteroidota bacterium]MBU1721115.1 ORF6N domain-containing protein [Bacteroidota bacterium]
MPAIPDEVILNKIYVIRDQKVMLDRDLAELYGVTTSNLNKAVKRNIQRFPTDFMFQLSDVEFKNLLFHSGTSRWGGTRKNPYVFTESGVAMLSGVLTSERAISVHIRIIRVFTKMRELLQWNKELTHLMEQVNGKLADHDNQIMLILEYIRQFEDLKQKQLEQAERKQIGYIIPKLEK